MSEKLGIMAQQTANATGVSPTGALSTAVDRMSFAHDIVMMTDDGIAIGMGPLDNQVNTEKITTLLISRLLTLTCIFKK